MHRNSYLALECVIFFATKQTIAGSLLGSKMNIKYLNYCRFTSQFKDEYKIPRGSIIELSRDRGHVLRTSSKIYTSLSVVFLINLYNNVIFLILRHVARSIMFVL